MSFYKVLIALFLSTQIGDEKSAQIDPGLT
jgi:hypothetical protein